MYKLAAISTRLRDTAWVALATAVLILISGGTAAAASSPVDQFALAGHRAYEAEKKAEAAAFGATNSRLSSCQALVQQAPTSFGTLLVLSELTATEADEPTYQAFARALGRVSIGKAALRAARAVIEREAKALGQLVAMKLDIDPCDYYAGWKAAGWAQSYNPYPSHVAALDFLPMYTPLAKADQLLKAGGPRAAKYATQFHEAALMTTLQPKSAG